MHGIQPQTEGIGAKADNATITDPGRKAYLPKRLTPVIIRQMHLDLGTVKYRQGITTRH